MCYAMTVLCFYKSLTLFISTVSDGLAKLKETIQKQIKSSHKGRQMLEDKLHTSDSHVFCLWSFLMAQSTIFKSF